MTAPDTPPAQRRANRPRGHGPASGVPASGIPAGGMGWGGPASGTPPQPFTEPPTRTGKAASLRAEIEARGGAAWLVAAMAEVVDDPSHPQRVAAISKLQDRLEGMPAQTVTITTPLAQADDGALLAMLREMVDGPETLTLAPDEGTDEGTDA